MIIKRNKRAPQLYGMFQIGNKSLVEIDQSADIKAFNAILWNYVAANAQTIATCYLLLGVVPKDQVLEMCVKLILVEALAGTLTDGKYKEEQLVKDDRQTELETRIKELEKNIPGDVLEEFRKVKTNRPKPVAVYENGRCSGCNMQLPPLYSSRIQNEKIVKCEHCGRILVVI